LMTLPNRQYSPLSQTTLPTRNRRSATTLPGRGTLPSRSNGMTLPGRTGGMTTPPTSAEGRSMGTTLPMRRNQIDQDSPERPDSSTTLPGIER
jgi:hypothetical protein